MYRWRLVIFALGARLSIHASAYSGLGCGRKQSVRCMLPCFESPFLKCLQMQLSHSACSNRCSLANRCPSPTKAIDLTPNRRFQLSSQIINCADGVSRAFQPGQSASFCAKLDSEQYNKLEAERREQQRRFERMLGSFRNNSSIGNSALQDHKVI